MTHPLRPSSLSASRHRPARAGGAARRVRRPRTHFFATIPGAEIFPGIPLLDATSTSHQ
jgi:hypothetical protein